ncbi:XRE family transcriptional regulator [Nocardiopsis gilva YIM 90087]|uniref:XRE family transcriptional regulator n=1 Tax=Nocardiopsis gilva YIM 90087 TaxID=1235441 RepID=A0A223S603_9ACTN|nr:helix-turn-helix transcriptional regulator [Nocardiopsis gilva]ASU83530.1 XRE family transcriptional regulator [Nocardiopsis gilva YIM 90087]
MSQVSSTESWARLASMLKARRVQVGYKSLAALSRETGVNYKTLQRAERGAPHPFTQGTLYEIDRAYQYEAGSIQRILDGGDPSPAQSSADEQASRDPDASLSGHQFYEPEFWEESQEVPAASLPVGWALLRNPMADEETVMWILMFSPGTWTQLRLPADYTQQQVLGAFRDSLKYIDKEKADLI